MGHPGARQGAKSLRRAKGEKAFKKECCGNLPNLHIVQPTQMGTAYLICVPGVFGRMARLEFQDERHCGETAKKAGRFQNNRPRIVSKIVCLGGAGTFSRRLVPGEREVL
jgi:hypothetical protein